MATEHGFLVPPNFKEEPPSDDDMNFASIIWGLSLGVTIFNCGKAMRQTQAAIRRRNRLTLYIMFIWLEVQCLIQIIINRVSLLMVVRRNGTVLKWTCFGILLAINISVFCVWIPARLQISEKYIHVNEIWDRMEKVLFAIMDAALNFYFIWVVKQRLVANGLQKYTRLYHMNMFLVAISIALDFHPLVYLCKLHIEMNMADLIGKVVRAGNNQADGTHDYSSRSRTTVKTGTRPAGASRFGGGLTRTHIELGEEDEIELKHRENLEGIKKTVITEVIRSPNSEDDEIMEHHERAVSEASSTNARHEPYSIEHAK
uniref:Integral membrane protein n=1 Tax=Fusarium oxysporum (strain Fo5176) TaxID=660025 RepID=A0A0D2Y2F5_FUSOF